MGANDDKGPQRPPIGYTLHPDRPSPCRKRKRRGEVPQGLSATTRSRDAHCFCFMLHVERGLWWPRARSLALSLALFREAEAGPVMTITGQQSLAGLRGPEGLAELSSHLDEKERNRWAVCLLTIISWQVDKPGDKGSLASWTLPRPHQHHPLKQSQTHRHPNLAPMTAPQLPAVVWPPGLRSCKSLHLESVLNASTDGYLHRSDWLQLPQPR